MNKSKVGLYTSERYGLVSMNIKAQKRFIVFDLKLLSYMQKLNVLCDNTSK